MKKTLLMFFVIFLFSESVSAFETNISNISETDGFYIEIDTCATNKIKAINKTGVDAYKVYILVYKDDGQSSFFSWDDKNQSRSYFIPVLPAGFEVKMACDLNSGATSYKYRARVYWVKEYNP